MTTVTTNQKRNEIELIFRPNNYRRRLLVKERKQPNSTILKRLPTIKKNWNMNQHTKLISIKFSDNITLQYGRKYLVAIWSQKIINGHKQSFLIRADSEASFDRWLNNKKAEIRDKLDTALFLIAKKLKIRLYTVQPIWSRHEDFIKGEEYIDKLPIETIIHDTVFKKVYGKGIEAIGGLDDEPVAKIKNFIKNRMLERFTPQIASELNLLNSKYALFEEKVVPSIQELAIHMKSHAKFMKNAAGVMQGTNKVLKKLDSRLSQKKLDDWK